MEVRVEVTRIAIAWNLLLAVSAAGVSADAAIAQYYVQGAREGDEPAVKLAQITVLGSEKLGAKTYRWWEMTLAKRDGSALGVRMLSELVPMTAASAPGEIVRYIYSPEPGVALDYRDVNTGKALLPEALDFVENFLPRPAPDARYRNGFANSGTLLGHALVRSLAKLEFPKVDFGNVKVLNLRPDLLVGSQADQRNDRDLSIPPEKRKFEPYTKEDYQEMIAAGANYFGPPSTSISWIRDEPVFYRAAGLWPDDFYRSNLVNHRMFLDEPMVRFGWDKGIPGQLASPDVAAEAIRVRLKAMLKKQERKIEMTNWPILGSIEEVGPKPPSWDTCFWSAFFQMAGGSPGLIHEGRYVHRGYDWSPEWLFGEGLEDLTDLDQYDFFNAFMRGAARAFNAYWGMSTYPEGDDAMKLPAMIRAYDMGARCIWFWGDDNFPYREILSLVKGLSEHVRRHPRGDGRKLLRRAEVGIAWPPGYAFSWNGTWGAERDQLNERGASYGDITAAAVWEGILCSRRGIEYDFLVDHPGIEKLGYKRLCIVQENGSVKVTPPWPESRAPKGLALSVCPKRAEPIAARMNAVPNHVVRRAARIAVDGDLTDWTSAEWIRLEGDRHFWADIHETSVTLKIPEDVTPQTDRRYVGFTYEQLDAKLADKYLLDLRENDAVVVVTGITPGGPADQAGLREGDAIFEIGGKRIKWAFVLWGEIERWRSMPGRELVVRIYRSGKTLYRGAEDLSAKFAFQTDDSDLYVAADVSDDVQHQKKYGWELWAGDSVQIGLDPLLERRPDSYGENGHEIGFALTEDGPVVWRWVGRRGQPVGRMKNVKLAIRRLDGRTIYEAAIPLSELAPLSPDMWPQCGINVVINDSDGKPYREKRLELCQGAMTHGKRPERFAAFKFDPSPNAKKVSAALMWDKRCMHPGGSAKLTLALRSPATPGAKVFAELRSLDSPKSAPARAALPVAVSSQPMEWVLTAATNSPPGRYKLFVTVKNPDGAAVARDGLPVFVYP